ncbi:hypothetical protein D3C85_1737800 [compost metagenome]
MSGGLCDQEEGVDGKAGTCNKEQLCFGVKRSPDTGGKGGENQGKDHNRYQADQCYCGRVFGEILFMVF